ncbi:MAG TPA: PAS domain-containing sensor histidine kinase [Gemmatimonadaceae bacterium]|nr:PAS domain-containing sensor histidine kinase [Gemmatimonadaceae bacterium]
MDEQLDLAPCGFVSFGDDGGMLAVNATLTGRLGYDRDELIGRHVETILAVGSRIFYQTHLFPLVRLHGKAEEIFMLLRGKDGEQIGVLCNAVRRPRGSGHVTDCVLMEVRERRKFEDALLQAKQEAESAHQALQSRTAELERANRQLESQSLELELQQQHLEDQASELTIQGEALQTLNDELVRRGEELERQRVAANEANQGKSMFLAVMSHELRTPLNAIGGYVQLLEMGVHGSVTDAQREALGRIDRSQRHLLRLINDLLNLSRIEVGRVHYTVESVGLAGLVANVMPMVEPQIAARGLLAEISVPPAAIARVDPEKVEQILLNLLSNAVKFTGAGGSVVVTGGNDPSSETLVYIRVSDTGLGIPSAFLERIFEPFIQVDDSATRSSEGTGLGLAISRDLARGMGGDLTAESELGRGSAFTLTLPRDVDY